MSKKLTDDQIKEAAIAIEVEPAALKAVAVVESGKDGGFLASGEPVILFERHVFWRELVKRGIDPARYAQANASILSRTAGGYTRGAGEHARLQQAAIINREAALSSASWGMYQIMGFNWNLCGFVGLQAFINAMYKDESEHLKAAIGFIKAAGVLQALKRKDWAAFAKGYNGAGYAANKYDIRLAEEYAKAKKAGW